MSGPLRSRRHAAACLALAALLAACGDAILITGAQPGVMTRVAGVPNRFGAELDSLATRTLLARPRGLAVGPGGTLYIADSENSRVVAVSSTGEASVPVAGDGCDGAGACLQQPYGLAVEADGTLWIADAAANRIFRVPPGASAVEVAVGTGESGSDPDGTAALAARIDSPTGIVVDGFGTIYFSERDGHRVRTIDPDGLLRTVAGTGEAGFSEVQPASSAMLDSPGGLALRGSTLYIADEWNHRVRAVDLATGTMQTVAGIGVAGYSEADTLAASARLNRPRALTLGADGAQLFVAEAGNHMVRLVGLRTGRITRFAGTGARTLTPDAIDAAETSLYEPSGLATYRGNQLFIADTGHHIVWRTALVF